MMQTHLREKYRSVLLLALVFTGCVAPSSDSNSVTLLTPRGGLGGISSGSGSNTTVSASAPLLTVSQSSGLASEFNISASGLLQNSGGVLYLYDDAACGHLSFSTGTASAASVILLVTLSNPGVYAFSAKFKDGLFNSTSGCSSPVSYTVLAPTIPSALALSSPTSSPNVDPTPQLQVVVASALGASIYSDSTCTQLLGSSSVGNGYFITSALPVGVSTLYAASHNAGGYHSACTSAFISYEVLPPPLPTALSMVDSSPGYLLSPRVSVSGPQAGHTVKVYSDNACTNLLGSALASGSPAIVTLSPLTSAGSYSLYATSTTGSTSSACSTASTTYQLDKLPSPSGIVLVAPLASPHYFPTPVVRVSGSTLLQASLYTDSACASQTGTTVSGIGSIDIQAGILSAGVHTFYAKNSGSGFLTSNCSITSLGYEVIQRISFSPYVQYGVAGGAAEVKIADLNNDGALA